MTPTEANVLLTKAGIVDPRMRRTDPAEAADRAEAWAEILSDVALPDALEALAAHYRSSKDALMPADVLEHLGVAPNRWAGIRDLDEEENQRRLDAAGVTREDVLAHRHEPGWLERTFGVELEAGGSA